VNPPVIIGNAALYNMDCMDLLKATPDKFYDLAIVDPPYGIERFKKGGSLINKHGSADRDWNNEKPTQEYFKELSRVSKFQIIWGGNNFNLPSTEYFVIWQKGDALDFSFAMVEMAWTNVKKPAKIFKHLHVQTHDVRIHPTQKPVKLYEWLLTNYAKQGDKILDTHLGSGSHAIACNNLGFDLTACELDKDYFDASVKRITAANQQIRMFA